MKSAMLILGIVIIIVGIGTAIYQSTARHRYYIRMYGDDIIDGYAIIVIGIIFYSYIHLLITCFQKQKLLAQKSYRPIK